MTLKILIILNSLLIPCFMGHKPDILSSIFGKNLRKKDQSHLELSNNKTTEMEIRIMGGENAKIKDFPWMAGIYEVHPGNEYAFGGAASIITKKHLLTAAHLLINHENVPRGPIVIMLGSEFLYKGEVFEVEKFYVHPGYPQASSILNDIGIIQLKDAIPFSDVMRPIALPGRKDTDFDGQVLTAIGWGYTSNNYDGTYVLKKVDIPIIPQKTCQQYTDLPSKQYMCGGDLKGIMTCSGDSGGPLMAKKDGEYIIVGVTSFGFGDPSTPSCGIPSLPSYFSKVATYLDWINLIISDWII